MKLSHKSFYSRKRPLAMLATAAMMAMIGALVPSAFAAAGTPEITVTVVNNNIAVVIGHNFTAGSTADVQVTAGADVQAASAMVETDGRFSATTFLPDNYSGAVNVTATAGAETASGTTTATGTGAGSGMTADPSPVPQPVPDPAAVDPATTPADPGSASSTPPAAGGQKLGVGGVATPADAKLTTADSTEPLHITAPGVYDGQGHKVGKIFIEASDVTVQNFNICSNDVDGVQSMGNTNVTIQNNDIKCVSGNDDLNAIEFYGNNINILYNTAVDWVNGSEGGSHTDFIQTWNNDPGESSSNVRIIGNRAEGPSKSENKGWYIHQCVMAQGKAATDGGGGGDGNSENWLIAENTFKDSHNQCIKLEDIDNAHVTRNTFIGDASRVIEIRDTSEGTYFYDDNKVEGSYGSVGVDAKPGPGPASLPTATAPAAAA